MYNDGNLNNKYSSKKISLSSSGSDYHYIKLYNGTLDTNYVNDGPIVVGYTGGALCYIRDATVYPDPSNSSGIRTQVGMVLQWQKSGINVNGNVEVKKDLKVYGNIEATSFNATSDIRLKSNILSVPSQWKNIQSLQPVYYKWKTTNTIDHGFIAQDVYKIYPGMRPNFDNLDPFSNPDFPIDYSGNPLYYTLDYSKMTPYLWKGLQEAIEMIEHQQTQIDQLIATVETLTKSVKNPSSSVNYLPI